MKEKYSSTEVVLVGEVIKLIVAGFFSINDTAETGFFEFNVVPTIIFMLPVSFLDAVGVGFAKLSWLVLNSKRIIVLVLLYSLANLLTYYALARVEASVYSVLLQVDEFTTSTKYINNETFNIS